MGSFDIINLNCQLIEEEEKQQRWNQTQKIIFSKKRTTSYYFPLPHQVCHDNYNFSASFFDLSHHQENIHPPLRVLPGQINLKNNNDHSKSYKNKNIKTTKSTLSSCRGIQIRVSIWLDTKILFLYQYINTSYSYNKLILTRWLKRLTKISSFVPITKINIVYVIVDELKDTK